jgi:pyrimidine-nucleoside phosphorylase
MRYIPAELIKKKRNGHAHDTDEIRFIVDSFVRGELPEYQMSAWLMAVFFKGMTAEETATLTEVMLHSGRTLDFSHLSKLAVDKHSTGGVGDKTSMILAPIAAAAGAPVPMIAGRGLGHTGGTLDKLEAIPGFRIGLSLDELCRQVETHGVAIVGQTAEICPADKKIYALRDVTGTVESLPLICASIMSKKLAEGIGALVLDVKYGSGAFMKTFDQAETLADKLMEIGVAHGKKVAALLTNMEQPLGRFIGNSLELGECIAILKGESFLGRSADEFADCRELSLELAGYMIWLSGCAPDVETGLKKARQALESGAAWEKFAAMCALQGGSLKGRNWGLPLTENRFDVCASQDGVISALDTEKIGLAALSLGCGRAKATDPVDHSAGIEVHRKLGDGVRRGDVLYTLFADSAQRDRLFSEAARTLLGATTISLQKPHVPSLITKRKVSQPKGH